jgi:hypothetical protein
MGWVIAILVVAYFGMAKYVGSRYYARRHGIGWVPGGQGVNIAAWIGLTWPVTLWLSWVRDPKMCNHHRHVLEHARVRAEIEQVEEFKRQRGVT